MKELSMGELLMLGREVEFTKHGRDGKVKQRVRGVVVKVYPGELYNVTTRRKRSAVRFVIKDKRGKLHDTGAVAKP